MITELDLPKRLACSIVGLFFFFLYKSSRNVLRSVKVWDVAYNASRHVVRRCRIRHSLVSCSGDWEFLDLGVSLRMDYRGSADNEAVLLRAGA